MTQEGCEDFYGLQQSGDITCGCCLICEDRYDGCLCYDCNCSKCYWLIPKEEWNEKKRRCGLALLRSNKIEVKKDGDTNTPKIETKGN